MTTAITADMAKRIYESVLYRNLAGGKALIKPKKLNLNLSAGPVPENGAVTDTIHPSLSPRPW